MSGFSAHPVGQPTQGCSKHPTNQPPHWVTIEMVDEEDRPVAWMAYKITLPNGDIARGFLNDKGRAKITGIPTAGSCQVTFPDLDQDAWTYVGTTQDDPGPQS